MVGPPEKLKAFVTAVQDETEILEVVRSGALGILRGKRSLKAH